MRTDLPPTVRHGGAWVWACIVAAVALIAALGSAIAVYDVRRHVEMRREDELAQRESHAQRSADTIATQLTEEGTSDLSVIRGDRRLRAYWSRALTRQPYRLYAAVVAPDGTVIAHTDRRQEGEQLIPSVQQTADITTGVEIVEVSDEVLTSSRRALDVRVPIRQGDKLIGTYHAGIDADWLDDQLEAERASRGRFWAFLVSGTCVVLLVSSIGVVHATRHTARLEHEIDLAHARRVSEMHELVLGIAHEIRNPLNAIRLNVHTVGQVFRDEAALSDEEIATMLDEMEDEVVRLESLMQEMLGFVRKKGDKPAAPMEVAEEVRRTLALVRTNLEQRRVDVHVDFDDAPCIVAMDPTRLRQVLLNLLNNAIDALPEGGLIEVAVRATRSQVEITVADDGPGIAREDWERVFVPFFSTKASGTGLGLALARKFIEEAGGTIRCSESPLSRGTCFEVTLPASAGAAVEAVR
jgi:two-component system, NtrC family, sensor histidine kinase HydH